MTLTTIQTAMPASLSTVPRTPVAITACTTGRSVVNASAACGTTYRIATTQTATPSRIARIPYGLAMVV